MDLQEAIEKLREGDLGYFRGLGSEVLQGLCQARDEDGRSLLHTAVVAGSVPLYESIIEILGDHKYEMINSADDGGWTPLHSAASCGHEALVMKLLEMGAKVDPLTLQYRTPLMYAASKGHLGIVRELINHGANLKSKDVCGATVLHRAAGAGKDAIVDLVLKETGHQLLEVPDLHGSTPLLAAATGGHAATVKLLVESGADPDASDKKEELTSVALKDVNIREAIRSGLASRQTDS